MDEEVDSFALRALFSTLTNVNFSHTAFYDSVNHSRELAERMRSKVLEATDKPDWCDAAMPHMFLPVHVLYATLKRNFSFTCAWDGNLFPVHGQASFEAMRNLRQYFPEDV